MLIKVLYGNYAHAQLYIKSVMEINKETFKSYTALRLYPNR